MLPSVQQAFNSFLWWVWFLHQTLSTFLKFCRSLPLYKYSPSRNPSIHHLKCYSKRRTPSPKHPNKQGFPGGSAIKNPSANAGETWVQLLIQEDPMFPGVTELVCHNYWSLCTPEPVLRNRRPLQWEVHTPHVKSSPHSPQLEESPHSSEDPAQPKVNKQQRQQNKKPRITSWAS